MGRSVWVCGAQCILGSRIPMTVCITSAPHQCRALGNQKRVKGKNGFFIVRRVTQNRFRETRVRYVPRCIYIVTTAGYLSNTLFTCLPASFSRCFSLCTYFQ